MAGSGSFISPHDVPHGLRLSSSKLRAGLASHSAMRRRVNEIRRQRRPLIVLNDANDHRTVVSADHGAAPALGVKEVLVRLEHLVRNAVEARPQVEAEVLAAARTDDVDVPETDPVDHTQLVVCGRGELPGNPLTFTAMFTTMYTTVFMPS